MREAPTKRCSTIRDPDLSTNTRHPAWKKTRPKYLLVYSCLRKTESCKKWLHRTRLSQPRPRSSKALAEPGVLRWTKVSGLACIAEGRQVSLKMPKSPADN